MLFIGIFQITNILLNFLKIVTKGLKAKKKMTKVILAVGGGMWGLTLTGVSVGLGRLKIQGE